jgi:hypothetical protein
MVLMLGVCAVFTLEPWPLTSLRLFSQIRTDRQTQVQLVVVEAEGTRRVIDFGDNAFVSDSAQRRLPEIASLPVAEGRRSRSDHGRCRCRESDGTSAGCRWRPGHSAVLA